MKKKYIIIILGVLIFICGLIILIKKENLQNKKNSLQIIDATYSCQSVKEKFYEDDNYVYYFPCVKSKSIYVKFENGNKMVFTEKCRYQSLLTCGGSGTGNPAWG